MSTNRCDLSCPCHSFGADCCDRCLKPGGTDMRPRAIPLAVATASTESVGHGEVLTFGAGYGPFLATPEPATAQVWKWEVPIANDNEVHIRMPLGAKILSFQLQGETPCLWALVDPKAPHVDRLFRVAGTGVPFLHRPSMRFLGTVQDPRALTRLKGPLVWHLFEEDSPE